MFIRELRESSSALYKEEKNRLNTQLHGICTETASLYVYYSRPYLCRICTSITVGHRCRISCVISSACKNITVGHRCRISCVISSAYKSRPSCWILLGVSWNRLWLRWVIFPVHGLCLWMYFNYCELYSLRIDISCTRTLPVDYSIPVDLTPMYMWVHLV